MFHILTLSSGSVCEGNLLRRYLSCLITLCATFRDAYSEDVWCVSMPYVVQYTIEGVLLSFVDLLQTSTNQTLLFLYLEIPFRAVNQRSW
jgi:hypothetical protein